MKLSWVLAILVSFCAQAAWAGQYSCTVIRATPERPSVAGLFTVKSETPGFDQKVRINPMGGYASCGFSSQNAPGVPQAFGCFITAQANAPAPASLHAGSIGGRAIVTLRDINDHAIGGAPYAYTIDGATPLGLIVPGMGKDDKALYMINCGQAAGD